MKVASVLKAGAAALAMTALAAGAYAAETKGPVTDDIGVVKIAKGEPVVIGAYMVLSGADAAIGIDELRGVEIAVEDFGGELMGHPIRLVHEDSLCSAEGGQTAATKLAANQRVLAVAGAACSSATLPGASIMWKAGIPSVGISPTSPRLTMADRNPDLHGFARVVWNDIWAGQTAADWAHDVLGAKTAAAIHDGSPYAQGYADEFLKQFASKGGKALSAEAISPTDTDMRPVLTRISSEKPDVLFIPIFVQATGQIARQMSAVGGLEKTVVLGSEGALVPQFLELAGTAAKGFKVAINDTSPEVQGAGYPEFLKKYEEKYGEKPINSFHHFGYDATMVILNAVKAVAKQGDDGALYVGRKALRDAIFATKDHQGLSGTKTCDANGDCGVYNFSVFEYVDNTTPFELGVNPKKVYPN